MANKNINLTKDDLDRPNAGGLTLPENHSVRDYVKRPQIHWVALLMFASVPGLIALLMLWMLWMWAGSVIANPLSTASDRVLASIFRGSLVLSIPILALGGTILALARGYAGVQHSLLVRMQNHHPVDVRQLTWRSSDDQRAWDLTKHALDQYYGVERVWAKQSAYRNIAGVYSPTFQGASPPAQLTAGDEGWDDENGEPLALPPEVSLEDVFPRIPSGHLGYGVGLDGELITAPVGRAYHAIRQGDTGAGKTTNLNAEIVQVHELCRQVPGRFELYAGDFKGEFEATWGKSPLFIGGINTSPAEIADMLEENMKEISRRYKLFGEASPQTNTLIRNVAEYTQATGEAMPWRLVYLDEVNALLGGTIPKRIHDRIDAALKRGLQLGRGAGLFYECGAQYMTKDLFDREGSKQFVTRAYFGVWDHTAMNMVFLGRVGTQWGVEFGDLLDGTAGRGVYSGVGGQPVPFQGLNVSVPTIMACIRAITVDTQTQISPDSPGNDFRTVSPAGNTRMGFHVSSGSSSSTQGIKSVSAVSDAKVPTVAELLANDTTRQYFAARIRQSIEQKVSKKEVLLELFRARPGKGEAWITASAFYDEIARSAQEAPRATEN